MDLTPETAEFLGVLVTALATILTAAITVFAPLLWGYLRKKAAKAGIELTDEHRRLVEAYAIEAVRWSEEQARKRLRRGTATTSEQKLGTARARFLQRCLEDGVRCQGDVTAKLESVLNRERNEPPLLYVPGAHEGITPVERPVRGGA